MEEPDELELEQHPFFADSAAAFALLDLRVPCGRCCETGTLESGSPVILAPPSGRGAAFDAFGQGVLSLIDCMTSKRCPFSQRYS